MAFELFAKPKQSNLNQPVFGSTNPYRTTPFGLPTSNINSLTSLIQPPETLDQRAARFARAQQIGLAGGTIPQRESPSALAQLISFATQAPTSEGPVADAARLLAPAFAGNPMIAAEGLSQLQRGRLPLLSQIDPRIAMFTSPVMMEALKGLMSSGELRPQDLSFILSRFMPTGTEGGLF